MGTRTHEDDYLFLEKCVERARRAGQNIELHVVGVRARDTAGPDWVVTHRIPERCGPSYPAFVHWLGSLSGFDAGVAPLLSSAFNDCKSHIKVLDYAALGLPSIASGMPAYEDSLMHTEAMFARNDVASWVEAMHLMGDRNSRERIFREASRRVGPGPFIAGCEQRLASLAA